MNSDHRKLTLLECILEISKCINVKYLKRMVEGCEALRKRFTGYGMGSLVAGIIGLFCGLDLLITVPASWTYGVLVIIFSLGLMGFALNSREEVAEEHEKPMIDVVS